MIDTRGLELRKRALAALAVIDRKRLTALANVAARAAATTAEATAKQNVVLAKRKGSLRNSITAADTSADVAVAAAAEFQFQRRRAWLLSCLTSAPPLRRRTALAPVALTPEALEAVAEAAALAQAKFQALAQDPFSVSNAGPRGGQRLRLRILSMQGLAPPTPAEIEVRTGVSPALGAKGAARGGTGSGDGHDDDDDDDALGVSGSMEGGSGARQSSSLVCAGTMRVWVLPDGLPGDEPEARVVTARPTATSGSGGLGGGSTGGPCSSSSGGGGSGAAVVLVRDAGGGRRPALPEGSRHGMWATRYVELSRDQHLSIFETRTSLEPLLRLILGTAGASSHLVEEGASSAVGGLNTITATTTATGAPSTFSTVAWDTISALRRSDTSIPKTPVGWSSGSKHQSSMFFSEAEVEPGTPATPTLPPSAASAAPPSPPVVTLVVACERWVEGGVALTGSIAVALRNLVLHAHSEAAVAAHHGRSRGGGGGALALASPKHTPASTPTPHTTDSGNQADAATVAARRWSVPAHRRRASGTGSVPQLTPMSEGEAVSGRTSWHGVTRYGSISFIIVNALRYEWRPKLTV